MNESSSSKWFERDCESLRKTEWDFDDLFYDVFEYLGTSFMCTIYMYVCILVYAKLVYLLSFVLIIVYCDSVSVNQDWFVMSVEKNLNGEIRWFGMNFKFFCCSLRFIFVFSRIWFLWIVKGLSLFIIILFLSII